MIEYFEWRNDRDEEVGHANQWELIHNFCDQRLRPGDAIISFNYDCSLERVLLQQGRFAIKYIENWPNIQFLIPNKLEPRQAKPEEEILLLKVHGSVGWHAFANHPSFGIPPKHLKGLGADPNVEYPHGHSWALNRTMIVPTWFKSFQPDHLFAHLWKQALQVMADASERVMIGYSFPDADTASWVLRNAPCKAGSGQWKFVDRSEGDEGALHDSFESWMSRQDSR